jgi:phosphoribosylformylglycinamidine synthase
VVGVLGLTDSLERRPPGAALLDGADLVLLGRPGPLGLGGSRWAADVHGHRGGMLPVLDLVAHAALLELVRALVADGAVSGIHDVAEGGLAACLAEMAVKGAVGFTTIAGAIADHDALFSEAPSRVVVGVDPSETAGLVVRVTAAGVPATVIGRAGGDRLVVDDLLDVTLEDATRTWREFLPRALSSAR